MEMGDTPPGGRDAQGRWLPGQSGNAAGKQPGTRNRATVLREWLRDGEEGEAVRAIIEKAKAGHWAAARFVVEGIAPKPRGRLIELDLPDDVALPDAIDRVVLLMARGEITMEEAQLTIRILREKSSTGAAATVVRDAAAAHAAPPEARRPIARAHPPAPAQQAPEPASSLHLHAAAREAIDQALGGVPASLGSAPRRATPLAPPAAPSAGARGAQRVA